jgi:hypothetical protein
MGAWGYSNTPSLSIIASHKLTHQGLFQSDHDLDIVDELCYEAGLNEPANAAEAQAKAAGKSDKEIKDIYYTLSAQTCSDIPAVRAHLDSGMLAKLIKEKEDKMLAEEQEPFSFRDPCYIYILLGACAMTLGCQLPDSYISMLKELYKGRRSHARGGPADKESPLRSEWVPERRSVRLRT